MKVAVMYATYGHWTQSLKYAFFKDQEIAYHFQPDLSNDPESDFGLVPDRLASMILRMNFPEIEIRKPDANDEAYDLIVGSPPCVGFSRANPKACPDHPLNMHTLNFFKWVVLNGPKHFLMEMVPGILDSQDPSKGPGIFNQCLHLIGEDYRRDYAVMDAAEYGAAQTRKCLYVWGNRRDQEPLESPLASLPKREFAPVGEVLPEELVKYWDTIKPDGRNLLSLTRKDGKPIAGAWGSLTPKKRDNRTLHREGLMFTITSTSVRDCLHYSSKRLLSIPELKLLMGFPIQYKLPVMNAGMASKVIASGVDVRFASRLLDHIRTVLEA